MFPKTLVFLICCSLLLAACAGAQWVGPTPEESAAPTGAPEMTATPSPAASATELPPTPLPPTQVTEVPTAIPTEGVDFSITGPLSGTGSTSALPFRPAAGDEQLNKGSVVIDSTELVTMESYPPQYVLSVKGSLPTPCHKLRIQALPANEKNQIDIEMYSVVNPDEVCAQVLVPFQVQIPLGSYSTGKYTVTVNGEKTASFTP